MSDGLRLPANLIVALVISMLGDRIQPTQPPMLIGAEARDILHAELGHSFQNRATEDVDLAFAIPDWDAYRRLVAGLEEIGDSGIAFRIAGVHVDVMAFGSIESPRGTVIPPFRSNDPLDVFGMEEVYETAVQVTLGNGYIVRLPTVAGYVALKLKAWIDRSAMYNYKDAPDVGLALYWAAESEAFTSRVWVDYDLIDDWGADVALAGAALLGRDIRQQLGASVGDKLADLFTVESRGRLARLLSSDAHALGLGDESRRSALLGALQVGLCG